MSDRIDPLSDSDDIDPVFPLPRNLVAKYRATRIDPLNDSRTLLDVAGDTPQPHNASVGRNPWDVLHAIGLNPDMTIGELRQRLGTDDA